MTTPQGNDRQFLSASLRSAALREAALLAEEAIPSGMTTVGADVAQRIVGKLMEVPAFALIDLSRGRPEEIIQWKLEEFAQAREEAARKGKRTSDWFIRCLKTWIKDLWDPYNEAPYLIGDGAHFKGGVTHGS